jgi:hypothetical protein
LNVVLKTVLLELFESHFPHFKRSNLPRKIAQEPVIVKITISKSGPNSEIPIVSFELGQEAIEREAAL